MERKLKKECRVQYLLPSELHERMKELPLIYLPLAPLEWHGPHLAVGTDPIIAEQVTLAVAERIGGVVLPTLYMGTERERSDAMLKSLGFKKGEYVVGMDFPEAKGLYKSFYFPEEVFSLTVRYHIELCIEHGYKYIFIVNGHGADNHNDVLRRLCREYSNKVKGVTTAYAMACSDEEFKKGNLSHAGIDETSQMMYFNQDYVDLKKLPPVKDKLKYKHYSIVDNGGFSGSPGEGFAVPGKLDPRKYSNAANGKRIFENTVCDVERKVKASFKIK